MQQYSFGESASGGEEMTCESVTKDVLHGSTTAAQSITRRAAQRGATRRNNTFRVSSQVERK
jgi:hypothetical protein